MQFVQTSSNTSTVRDQLDKQLARRAEEWSKVLRTHVVIYPTTERGFYLHFPVPHSWKEYCFLIMVHWYLPDDLSALIDIELQRFESKFGIDKRIQAHCILKSKTEMLTYLLESNAIFKTEREAFGSILRPFEWNRWILTRRRRRKPKKKIFRRGYNDKGSKRLLHERHSDFAFGYQDTELQNEIEKTEQEIKDTLDLIEGFLQ